MAWPIRRDLSPMLRRKRQSPYICGYVRHGATGRLRFQAPDQEWNMIAVTKAWKGRVIEQRKRKKVQTREEE